MQRDPITGAVIMPGQNVVGADPTRNIVPSIMQPKQVITGNTIKVGDRAFPAPTQAQFDTYNAKKGMTPPAAKPAPAAAPAAAPVTPSAANGNLVVAAASDTTPYTMDQRQEMATNKGINMELAQNRRRESDALASANGYDVTYDEDGTRRLTPLANASSGRGMTSGTPDSGIGGNVYQRQLENMQNMRLRSDMMDQIDYLQRRVQAGDRGIGDLPSYRADQAALAKLMGQSGPGGEMEQTKAAVAGRLAEADVSGRYGMMGEQLKGQNQMAIEQIQSGDRRYNTDSTAASNAAKLAQEGQLALPKFWLETAKLQYLQNAGLTPEALAAIEGKYTEPKFGSATNEAGQAYTWNERTGEIFSGGTNAPAGPTIPPAAQQFLLQNANNPKVIADFEAKFGKGAAQMLLSQR